eukprot:3336968-Pleurochrysis_carterae.AAC.3
MQPESVDGGYQLPSAGKCRVKSRWNHPHLPRAMHNNLRAGFESDEMAFCDLRSHLRLGGCIWQAHIWRDERDSELAERLPHRLRPPV